MELTCSYYVLFSYYDIISFYKLINSQKLLFSLFYNFLSKIKKIPFPAFYSKKSTNYNILSDL